MSRRAKSRAAEWYRAVVGLRGIALIIGDVTSWIIALALATLARYDFRPPHISRDGYLMVAALVGVAQIAFGFAFGLYTSRYRLGSVEEARSLLLNVIVVTVCTVAAVQVPQTHPVPRGAVISAGFIAVVLAGGIRHLVRLGVQYRNQVPTPGATRILVFGAGEGGQQALDAMLRTSGGPYLPVALLDDSPSKRNLRLRGVRVEGDRDRMKAVAARHDASAMLIAIPSADGDTIRELSTLAYSSGLTVKVLPPVVELFGKGVDMVDIRDISVEDLLGRRRIETDVASIAEYLTGRRVMVTGAGGSIGSEICRQVRSLRPSNLVMVDRDESALHALQLSLDGHGLLDTPDLVVNDIRDRDGLRRLLRERRPNVVFHAAALKHLPLLERYPGEAIQTNVWGTLNVLGAAIAAGVDHFVNISTDKAADPTSVLGASKRIAERLTAGAGQMASGRFVSVRFGNVLGSRGSVLAAFQAQAKRGGPITVTHPDVTRFFMTISEAVELVIQAGAIGRSGEVLVLEMGDPVRLCDVAERYAATTTPPAKLEFTGLRQGEKLHEVLLGRCEIGYHRQHPLIQHVVAPPLWPEAVSHLDPGMPPHACTKALADLCDVSTHQREPSSRAVVEQYDR